MYCLQKLLHDCCNCVVGIKGIVVNTSSYSTVFPASLHSFTIWKSGRECQISGMIFDNIWLTAISCVEICWTMRNIWSSIFEKIARSQIARWWKPKHGERSWGYGVVGHTREGVARQEKGFPGYLRPTSFRRNCMQRQTRGMDDERLRS